MHELPDEYKTTHNFIASDVVGGDLASSLLLQRDNFFQSFGESVSCSQVGRFLVAQQLNTYFCVSVCVSVLGF